MGEENKTKGILLSHKKEWNGAFCRDVVDLEFVT